MNRPVIVGPVEGGSARVDTRIDDAGVWFESADGALDTSAEAAGSDVLVDGGMVTTIPSDSTGGRTVAAVATDRK